MARQTYSLCARLRVVGGRSHQGTPKEQDGDFLPAKGLEFDVVADFGSDELGKHIAVAVGAIVLLKILECGSGAFLPKMVHLGLVLRLGELGGLGTDAGVVGFARGQSRSSIGRAPTHFLRGSFWMYEED
jgi:hypothetical protein